MTGRVLVVGGSDSSGGAGIQADLKTITMLGGYAASAITALTAQNTVEVSEVMGVPARMVSAQIASVVSDIGVDVVKTGMLYSAAIVAAVAEACRTLAPRAQLILDPVVVSSTGHELLSREGRETMIEQLLPRAALVTPNVPEATLLTGVTIERPADLGKAADVLLALGAYAVLMKGGHLGGDHVVDLLRTADGTELSFESARIDSRSTHGTGCTLASAIAAGVAEGLTLRDAIQQARDYVYEAIRSAPGLGKGFGPLNHAHPLGSRDPATH
jgi:hydroxymethylpyrimidine/phosphomethylpyrimidine kinase